jgi:hypothetical protein
MQSVAQLLSNGRQSARKWAGDIKQRMRYSVTTDRRYFVVRGRLWRCPDPRLPAGRRTQLMGELMKARRDKYRAMRAYDAKARELARQRVD